MKLYGYYRSSASYRIRIILNLKGLTYENIVIRLDKGEQLDDAFRTINPMGFVPVLDDNDNLLAQSPAIAEFIEENYPDRPLLPADRIDRAKVREMMHTVGCDIHPLQNLRVLKYIRTEYGQDDEGIQHWCQRWMGAGFTAFEKLAEARSRNSQYAFGDQATLADVWLIPQLYNARRFGLDLTPFPTIVSIDAHCQTLPAFAAASPENQDDAPSPLT